MKIGYARVSTDAQETHLQMDALKGAKCSRVYEEKASGAKTDRPELMKLLDNGRQLAARIAAAEEAWLSAAEQYEAAVAAEASEDESA